MSNSLVDLPVELIDNIFAFSDDKSLLEMRKVSKFAKQLAEAAFLNRTDAPDITNLILRGEIECEISFTFKIDSEKRLRSKLFLVSAINYLQVPGMEYRSDELFATMSATETTSFFEQFTPFMRNAKCNAFGFSPSTPEMFSRTSTFFEGKTVGEIKVYLKYSEQTRDYILQLVDHLKSTYITVVLDIPVFRADNFLIQLAGIVDVLSITAPDTHVTEMDISRQLLSIQWLAYKILSSRCLYLDMTFAFYRTSLNFAKDCASLLRGIQGKDILFTLPSEESIISVDNSQYQQVAVVEKNKTSKCVYRIEIGNLIVI